MDVIICILVLMLYVGVGVFVARLMGEEDYPGFAITFWPIIVLLWIAMLIIVVVPCWLADVIKKWMK